MDNLLTPLYTELKSKTSAEKVILELLKLLSNDTAFEAKIQPLGFYMFSLGSIDENTNIRLHIWTTDNIIQNEQLMIHNHKFNITSYVICGSVFNKVYDVYPNSNGNGTLYEVEYDNEGSILNKIEKGFTAILKSQNEITEGNWYNVLAHEFHETIPTNDDFTATIVVTETVAHSRVSVFGKKDFGESLIFKRSKIPSSTYESLINAVKRKISYR